MNGPPVAWFVCKWATNDVMHFDPYRLSQTKWRQLGLIISREKYEEAETWANDVNVVDIKCYLRRTVNNVSVEQQQVCHKSQGFMWSLNFIITAKTTQATALRRVRFLPYTGFTYRYLHGFARFLGDSTALVTSATLCIAQVFATATCPSVCLSQPVLIAHDFAFWQGMTRWKIRKGSPRVRAIYETMGWVQKGDFCDFSTYKQPYLRNGAR